MKRTIKQNVYGNYVGYVGRQRMFDFGDDERYATHWLNTGSTNKDEAYS